MIKWIATILLCCSLQQLAAQEILSQPVAKELTRFPFRQYSGGVMVIRGQFGDLKDSLNFILDTGSGGISLDSMTCIDFGIPLKATDTTITGIGGIRKVAFAFNRTLRLPGLKIDNLNFHVNDYSVLSSVYGEKIDGIIGYSFFSRYIVNINFDSSMITVYSPGKYRYPIDGTTLHPAFTALPIQYLTIKDKRKKGFNFYFDTGAGLCLLLSDKFAQDSNIILSRRRPVITQAEGMGGKLQMRLTVIKEVKIGPYRFRNVPTYLYDDDFNVTSYPFTGGLVGNDLMRRFNLTINYPSREIHLEPNSHIFEAFDYAYTGLGMYMVENKIMVEDVIAGSPADKAHIKIGDEIFAVGKNFSNNIQAYKNILQTENQQVKVIIRRDGRLVEVLLNTESIR